MCLWQALYVLVVDTNYFRFFKVFGLLVHFGIVHHRQGIPPTEMVYL